MGVDAAHCPNTPLADVEKLFPTTRPCENCPIPPAWASPLTCKWVDNASTTQSGTQMLLLAGLMHRWLATFLDGDSHEMVATKPLLEERANLRQQIESFKPVAQTSTSEADSMYESCRWASLVLLAVGKQSIPIHIAGKQERLRPRLAKRLRMTDLSSLWGSHRGLLLWVMAVCYFVTAGKCFPLMCTTIWTRLGHEMAMSPYCSEIAIKQLKRLKTFESICCPTELTTSALTT